MGSRLAFCQVNLLQEQPFTLTMHTPDFKYLAQARTTVMAHARTQTRCALEVQKFDKIRGGYGEGLFSGPLTQFKVQRPGAFWEPNLMKSSRYATVNHWGKTCNGVEFSQGRAEILAAMPSYRNASWVPACGPTLYGLFFPLFLRIGTHLIQH